MAPPAGKEVENQKNDFVYPFVAVYTDYRAKSVNHEGEITFYQPLRIEYLGSQRSPVASETFGI